MRIVQQSAPASYSIFPFLVSPAFWLPAPSIAGLLPAPAPTPEPPPIESTAEPFTYSSPFAAELSESQRKVIYDAARILIDVAVEYMRDTLNDHAVDTAIMMYRQAIDQKPIKVRNPADYSALMNTPDLEYLIRRARREATRTSSPFTVTPDKAVDHE